jgi:hypothetical protein
MNTFLPKYMRQLERSGFVTNAVKRAAAVAAEAEKAATEAAKEAAKTKRSAKPRVECPNCGKFWINLGSHQRACKKHATTEEKEQHNQLPDLAHNLEHVTIRRTKPCRDENNNNNNSSNNSHNNNITTQTHHYFHKIFL